MSCVRFDDVDAMRSVVSGRMVVGGNRGDSTVMFKARLVTSLIETSGAFTFTEDCALMSSSSIRMSSDVSGRLVGSPSKSKKESVSRLDGHKLDKAASIFLDASCFEELATLDTAGTSLKPKLALLNQEGTGSDSRGRIGTSGLLATDQSFELLISLGEEIGDGGAALSFPTLGSGDWPESDD